MLRLSHAPVAIRTTAAIFTIAGAPFHAYATPSIALPAPSHNDGSELGGTTAANWVVANVEPTWSEPNAALPSLDDEHNQAIYAALVASQTEVSGPIFID